MNQCWILPNFLHLLWCWWIFLLISIDMLNILFAVQMFKSSIFWITIWTWCISFSRISWFNLLVFCCRFSSVCSWRMLICSPPSTLMPMLSFSGFDVRVFLSSKNDFVTVCSFYSRRDCQILLFLSEMFERICPCNTLGLESSFLNTFKLGIHFN